MTLRPYPATPTQRLLASLGACSKARRWVGARSLTECWARARSQRALDWGRWLVCAPAWSEYERASAPAWAEYDRVRALAWAAYERAYAPVWSEYDRARALAWAAYDRVCAPARAEYERVRALADACTTCAELRAAFPCPAVPS